MVHRYSDSGCHCFVIAVHVDLSRGFCISAASELGSAHEYVVKLLALCGCVVLDFVLVLLFVDRVGPYQSVLNCPVSVPLASGILLSECVSFDLLESTASCALKFPPINMCVSVSLHLSVCFWSSEYTCCTCSSPYPVGGKSTEETCSLIFFFTMETPVDLGPECCTYLMRLVHLLWMNRVRVVCVQCVCVLCW